MLYFFYTQYDDLVYIGKSIHIRKRVQQHFQGKDNKSRKIQRTVTRIAYEPMGSELIALLYESDLIKRHQPLYNCTQRRTMDPLGLYIQYENGYKALRIANNQERGDEIITVACFHYQIKSCYGACIDQESSESYNQRVDTFLHAHRFEGFTKLFEVEGRSSAEKGLVYIERGIYRGFGFCAWETPPAAKAHRL